jgi:hypothetical protein
MEKENKELDLLELMSQGLLLLKNIIIKGWNILLFLIKFHIRIIFIILPFLILGVFLSFYQTTKENRKQNAEFMLHINGKTNCYEVADIINVLAQTINPDTNNVILSQILKIDSKDVKKVSAINSFFVIDLNNNKTRDYVDYGNSFREDTLNSRLDNFLDVKISSKGEANFQKIQEKIVEYLNADPYIKNVAQERLKAIQEKMHALDIEIAALDSMRIEQLKNKGSLSLQLDKSSILLGKESSYYKEMMDLKGQKANLQADLILQPNAISSYSGVSVKSDKPTSSIYLKNVFIFYLFGLVLAFLFFYRKKIKALLKE